MFIPYKVDVPMQRWPMANWVLMGVTILISVAMFGPLDQWNQDRHPTYLPPEVTQALRDAGMAPQPAPSIVDAFLLQPGHFRLSQLVGNLFIHAGFFHLAGNMLFLFVFGNAVNAKLGHLKYVLIYLGAGILESAVWGLVQGGSSGVAYLAHVIGFLTGATAAAALLWFKLTEMDRQERSLLQVWELMPCDEEPVAPQRITGTMPDHVLRQQMQHRTLATQARRRDSGPISLD